MPEGFVGSGYSRSLNRSSRCFIWHSKRQFYHFCRNDYFAFISFKFKISCQPQSTTVSLETNRFTNDGGPPYSSLYLIQAPNVLSLHSCTKKLSVVEVFEKLSKYKNTSEHLVWTKRCIIKKLICSSHKILSYKEVWGIWMLSLWVSLLRWNSIDGHFPN